MWQRNPEPGDNPLLFSKDSQGSFRCTTFWQFRTVLSLDKPDSHPWYMPTLKQPTQDVNPGLSQESHTLCKSLQSGDSGSIGDVIELKRNTLTNSKIRAHVSMIKGLNSQPPSYFPTSLIIMTWCCFRPPFCTLFRLNWAIHIINMNLDYDYSSKYWVI